MIVAEIAHSNYDPFDISDPTKHFVQWINRDKRSYSVGSRIVDVRTGQILHGHARIESLRFREDALLVQALLQPYSTSSSLDGKQTESFREIIEQRCRQLVSHEVGHTIGML
jgi:hypothetical protein